jgi:hypothetical protein
MKRLFWTGVVVADLEIMGLQVSQCTEALKTKWKFRPK